MFFFAIIEQINIHKTVIQFQKEKKLIFYSTFLKNDQKKCHNLKKNLNLLKFLIKKNTPF